MTFEVHYLDLDNQDHIMGYYPATEGTLTEQRDKAIMFFYGYVALPDRLKVIVKEVNNGR